MSVALPYPLSTPAPWLIFEAIEQISSIWSTRRPLLCAVSSQDAERARSAVDLCSSGSRQCQKLEGDDADVDIGWQFQTVASNIIECFEKDWDDQGLARGCPDFMYTVLTFAVVSLLKVSLFFLLSRAAALLKPDTLTVRPSTIQGTPRRLARTHLWTLSQSR